MSEIATLGLARGRDALTIAEMSRDLIEHGRDWAWTPERVRRFIGAADSTVVVARRDAGIASFAIMHLGDENAHLNLLAVAPRYRRQGLGRRLIDWLADTAITAGVLRIKLELRLGNAGARAFYGRLGFAETGIVPNYYQGGEAALRMARELGAAGPGSEP